MRRFVPLLIAGAALIAIACSDSVAPTPTGDFAVRLTTYGGGPGSYASSVWKEDGNATTVTFTIHPAAGTATVGGFTLVYGDNAVCDPATSGYGPDTWLLPCRTLTTEITITAKFWYHDHRVFSDFSPNIRFSPDARVTIAVVRPEIIGKSITPGLALKYGIWYTVRHGDTRLYVDEAFNDPALVTQFDTNTGLVWRNIRHFSGYYVRGGEPCDKSLGDPECVETISASTEQSTEQ